jgi:hypothetical protein
MYTKRITFEKYLTNFDVWVSDSIRTTNDAIWLNLSALNLNKNIRKIVVQDI